MTDTIDKIKKVITRITELEAVKRHFDSILDEEDQTLKDKSEVENLMIEELKDVNTLEKMSVKSIFYKVLGSIEEQLEKERQEYLHATLKHKELLNALEVIEYEKGLLEKKIIEKDSLEKELEQLKNLRSKEILRTPGQTRNELISLLDKMDNAKKYEVELNEAFNAGERALDSLKIVIGHLKKAKNWGNYDMMTSKGGYQKAMKHGSIDRAMNEISRTKISLRAFNKELIDIGYENQRLSLQVDSIHRFPGIFFDNLISDWIVQNKIKGVLRTVENLTDDVMLILKSIEKAQKDVHEEYQELEQMRHVLLETK